MKNRVLDFTVVIVCLALFSIQVPAVAQDAPETQRLYTFIDGIIYNSWGIYYKIGPGETTRDKWPDYSDGTLLELNNLFQGALTTLKSDYNYAALDYQGKLTYRIFERYAKQEMLNFEYRLNSYAIDHRKSKHITLPSNLMNYFTIGSETDAANYLSRLDKISDVLDQVIANCERRRLFGNVPPKVVFPAMYETARNMVAGYPIESDSSEDNPLYADFKRKVEAINIPAGQKNNLMTQVEDLLINDMKPAYEELITYLKGLEDYAAPKIGVGSMPYGRKYYQMRLEYQTSTNLTAKKIHKLGKRNVRRIRKEMKQIMLQVNFPSKNLQDFFEFLRTDKQFYHKNTNSGRNRYLKKAYQYIDGIRAAWDKLFTVFPQSRLIVKRIEAYREQTSLRAWYSPGAVDGSRPGAYYLNLYDMKDQPTYDLEALSYHEGVPGHHFQVMLSQEKDYGTYLRPEESGTTAYIEGWALYTEKMPKAFGFYTDPYSDFGRLSMEMLRAVRLVVDTGMHHKGWSRQKVIDYMVKNTPETIGNITGETDRYAMNPAQATAYMIGKLKIEEIRAAAEKKLGKKFDIRAFHDELLTHGPLPLYLLEDVMLDWSDSVLSGAKIYTRPPRQISPAKLPQWVIDLRWIKKEESYIAKTTKIKEKKP